MKKMALDSLSHLRVYLRLPKVVFRLDLAVPVILLVYLLVRFLQD